MARPKRPAAYFVSLCDPPGKKWWPNGGQMQFMNALRGCLGLAPIPGEKPQSRLRERGQELGGAP